MRKPVLFSLLSLLLMGPFTLQASTQEMTANRINEKPRIDGKADDAVWQSQPAAFQGNFIQRSPDNLKPSAFVTEIKVAYDDQAFYVLARLYDPQPELIRRELGFRDGFGLNTDEFGLVLDTYNQGQNAFFFGVTAAGVQLDSYMTPGREDASWDAVWKSAVGIDEEGWTVEYEIPYSAIRFPRQAEQVWGLNFIRRIKRINEESSWNPIDASVSGLVNQSGKLSGLYRVDPPLRLQLLPYLSAVAGRDGETGSSSTNFGGGMDLKWGINESFTLDMALVPDFSQVQSDNQVLNLGPFEVQYAENRPFFTEGMDLFGKGGLLYSRRIGQVRYSADYEMPEDAEIVSAPSNAKLLNAVKISGRTKKGLGVGLMNAITDEAIVEYEYLQGDKTVREQARVDPLTNFNVIVLDQSMKNNSNIGLINTNVTRASGGRDANVTGVDFRLNNKNNTWRIWGFGAYSAVWANADENGHREMTDGYKYNVAAGKVAGTWQYNISRNVESEHYDINDMGYLQAPNEVSHGAELGYNRYNPFFIFNSFSSWAWVSHQQRYAPREYASMGMGWNVNMNFRNFWYLGIGHNRNPVDNHDFFESRVEGYRFTRLPSHNSWLQVNTDARKMVYFSVRPWFFQRTAWDSFDWGIYFGSRLRLNDQLSISPSIDYSDVGKERGFANLWDVNGDEEFNEQSEPIVFGERDRQTVVPALSVNYIFNARMGLNIRARHYWSQVHYSENYWQLQQDGSMEEIAYEGMHDKNYNAFNVDLLYQWQIAPGSFMTFAWKDAAYDLIDDRSATMNLQDNFQNFRSSPHSQTFSLRLTYFLDYQQFRNLYKRNEADDKKFFFQNLES